MELRVDDREKYVIDFLKIFKDVDVKIERATVGDYAIIYKGKIIAIIERKTLADLAASIKDGRMNNNTKLLDAQTKSGCHIIYIIEGSPYAPLHKKFGRIPFKALRGKLDSLQFRNNIKIIWTKNCSNTADRLYGLCHTLARMYDHDLFPDIKERQPDVTVGGVSNILKAKHDTPIDQIHVNMIICIKGITRLKSIPLLNVYTIQQLLLGQTDETTCYNIVYPNGKMKFGPRGTALHHKLKKINNVEQCKILSAVKGITFSTAEKILAVVKFEDIVKNTFADNAVAEIKKTENRTIGKAVELKIRIIFQKEKCE